MNPDEAALHKLKTEIEAKSVELGFALFGVSDVNLETAGDRLEQWLALGYQGDMGYMSEHGRKRYQPDLLVPNTVRCLCFAMEYQWQDAHTMQERLEDCETAYISRYTLGRDYHKVMRKRLQRLAKIIESRIGAFGYRVFTDSAPVMEKPLAEKASLGWIGKHSNVINKRRGSWFFLGEIYTDLPLPVDTAAEEHCGTCSSCMEVCPTEAIVAPYVVDARRCISYLTIENRGTIPQEFRVAMGNRIFGCDDCQLFCPFNRFSQTSKEIDFSPRHQLDQIRLIDAFNWSEEDFNYYTQGSAIRRTGYHGWLRNVAVAIGNSNPSDEKLQVLKSRLGQLSEMLDEHIQWAIDNLESRQKN